MPIYNFTCADCTMTVEMVMKIVDRNNSYACNDCGGSLERHKGRETPNQNVLRSGNRDRMHLVKEQLETREQMYKLPPEERAQYEKHIDKLAEARHNESKISDKEDFHKANNGMDITK